MPAKFAEAERTYGKDQLLQMWPMYFVMTVTPRLKIHSETAWATWEAAERAVDGLSDYRSRKFRTSLVNPSDAMRELYNEVTASLETPDSHRQLAERRMELTEGKRSVADLQAAAALHVFDAGVQVATAYVEPACPALDRTWR